MEQQVVLEVKNKICKGVAMIKVGLIVPRGSKYGKNQYLAEFLRENDIVSNFYGAWETPSLSLLTIAGLFPEEYTLQFIDEDHGEEIPFLQDFELVFVTGMTQQIIRAFEICEKFHELGVYTVIGGIHATIFPDEAMQHADTVLAGEGEDTVVRFLQDYQNGCVKSFYRSEGFIDLTKSPTPRYDLLNPSLYKSYSIQTTRGCPRTCSYCTLPVMYGGKYRHKTVEQVLEEIHMIKKIDKNPFIFFADDNMFINKENSIELLKALEKEDVIWGTQTDLTVANSPEILGMLKQAGCRWLFIGFENISESSLQLLDKKKFKAGLSKHYSELIEKIHEAGIYIWGSFMFGTDDDTEETFENVLDFVIKNSIYSCSFTILTPLPGTEIFEQMKRENRILDYDWSRYTFWDIVFKPKNMTAETLARKVAWIYDNFYSKENSANRLSAIRKRLKKKKEEEKREDTK